MSTYQSFLSEWWGIQPHNALLAPQDADLHHRATILLKKYKPALYGRSAFFTECYDNFINS